MVVSRKDPAGNAFVTTADTRQHILLVFPVTGGNAPTVVPIWIGNIHDAVF